MGRRSDANVLADRAAPSALEAPKPTLPQIFLAFLSLGATAFGGPANGGPHSHDGGRKEAMAGQ